MIAYAGGKFHPRLLFQFRGSVFPFSVAVAVPGAALAVLLEYLAEIGSPEFSFLRLDENDTVLGVAWSGVISLLGFLVVFRTSQAYSRFWEGCSAIQQMQGEWFDATSSLMAFCKMSQADKRDVLVFQHTLVRLVSLLNATVLMDLAEGSGLEKAGARAFELELIDAEGIDRASLFTINQTVDKVELIFQWIQQLIVESQCHRIFSVPPPVLSRSFHELATGMVRYHDAVKIAKVPFPFPYMQIMEVLLLFHWCITPFLTCMWVSSTFWAGVLTFMQIFFFWSLNAIASELENPFGEDVNDLPIQELQLTMNRRLLLLLRPSTHRTARLSRQASFDERPDSGDNPRLGARGALSRTGVSPAVDPASEKPYVNAARRISLGALQEALEDQSGVSLELVEDAGGYELSRDATRRRTEPVFEIREVHKASVELPPAVVEERSFKDKVLSSADAVKQSLEDVAALCQEMRDRMVERTLFPDGGWISCSTCTSPPEVGASPGPRSPCPVPEPGEAVASPRAAQRLGEVLAACHGA